MPGMLDTTKYKGVQHIGVLNRKDEDIEKTFSISTATYAGSMCAYRCYVDRYAR